MAFGSFKKEELELFLKIFLIVFVLALIAANWSIIKGVFNYEGVYEIDNLSEEKEDESSGPQQIIFPEKENSVEIPSLGITAPLAFVETKEKATLYTALREGAIHFPDTPLPGQKGQIIILGHSASTEVGTAPYADIFTELNLLSEGDEIFVFYKHKKYVYKVSRNLIIEKTAEVPKLEKAEEELVLMTCWPPGKDQKRRIVQTERILNF